jgi:hypothetical protein
VAIQGSFEKGEPMLDSWLRRLGAAAGLIYVLLAVVGNEVLGGGGEAPPINASAREIHDHILANPPTAKLWGALYVEVFALLLFIVFVSILYSVLRRSDDEHGFLSTTALGAGLVSVAVKMASIPAAVSVMYRAQDGVEPALAAALIDMNNFSFTLTWTLQALLLGATAVIVLRTSALPRWLGWSAAVIAPALLVGAATSTAEASFLPMMLNLIWIIAASITLVRQGGAPRAAMAAV